MKLNKFSWVLLTLAATTFVGCEHDDIADHHIENKLYITTSPVIDDLLLKQDQPEATRTISLRTALPAEQDITAKIEAYPALAAQYNLIYDDNAFALTEDHFSIPESEIQIKAGAVTTDDVVINFSGLDKLNAKNRYVLPVKLTQETGIGVLESRRTVFFVFKGAALINVVAEIQRMYFPISWSSAAQPVISNMKTITVEALLFSKDWTARNEKDQLSSIFGIEGSFLIRIGDADRGANEVQMVCPGGNYPGPNKELALPVNEWVHIALVWDGTTGERYYYINGKEVASDQGASIGSTVNLTSSCYIGKSWNDSRWLPGQISELRVWNVQRTSADIASNMYYVNPSTEGLVAYWKFDEGVGNDIKDHSPYKTNITSTACDGGSGNIKWIPVELPKFE